MGYCLFIFSKNMTVNLLIALIATNVVFASKKVYEGMRSKKRSKKRKRKKRKIHSKRS